MNIKSLSCPAQEAIEAWEATGSLSGATGQFEDWREVFNYASCHGNLELAEAAHSHMQAAAQRTLYDAQQAISELRQKSLGRRPAGAIGPPKSRTFFSRDYDSWG